MKKTNIKNRYKKNKSKKIMKGGVEKNGGGSVQERF